MCLENSRMNLISVNSTRVACGDYLNCRGSRRLTAASESLVEKKKDAKIACWLLPGFGRIARLVRVSTQLGHFNYFCGLRFGCTAFDDYIFLIIEYKFKTTRHVWCTIVVQERKWVESDLMFQYTVGGLYKRNTIIIIAIKTCGHHDE